MIVISTFNPNYPRSTEDEELLTTMLASLIRYRNSNSSLALWAKDEVQKVHFKGQVENADKVIALIFPLLGLTLTEVYELIEKDK